MQLIFFGLWCVVLSFSIALLVSRGLNHKNA